MTSSKKLKEKLDAELDNSTDVSHPPEVTVRECVETWLDGGLSASVQTIRKNRDCLLPVLDAIGDRVATRLSVDGAAARQVTEAMLETLAERIARGQVEDLIAQLDPLLHPPLRRGASSAGPGSTAHAAGDVLAAGGRARRGRRR